MLHSVAELSWVAGLFFWALVAHHNPSRAITHQTGFRRGLVTIVHSSNRHRGNRRAIAASRSSSRANLCRALLWVRCSRKQILHWSRVLVSFVRIMAHVALPHLHLGSPFNGIVHSFKKPAATAHLLKHHP